jgi:hypothetical protein
MTAARQERKSLRPRLIAVAIVTVVACHGLNPAAILAATGELIVANRYTGLAIDGFDPVAYFVDAAPKLGRADLELRGAGAVWRFRNEGNRAAFKADPEVYMPRFGGHDPIAIARGAATPGHPRIWLVANDRLYLFYNAPARAAFAEDPERAIKAAERHWPAVLRALAR